MNHDTSKPNRYTTKLSTSQKLRVIGSAASMMARNIYRGERKQYRERITSITWDVTKSAM
jgi:hypothetical protein